MPNPKGGLLCTILGMIMAVAVSVSTANGATGYACYSSTPINPKECSSHTFTFYTGGWVVFGCNGSNVRLLYGASGCSATLGTHAIAGNPTFSDSGGRYCWCKMYGTDLGTVSGSWVFTIDGSTASNCAYGCASACAYDATYAPNFRDALFSN
ncbi:MAG: hypothetical protein LBD50_01870 [Rickettsiales bacterium]|jgi:hypothetical protein|nr:hypothetical protein [Rickettsiales bacterium]